MAQAHEARDVRRGVLHGQTRHQYLTENRVLPVGPKAARRGDGHALQRQHGLRWGSGPPRLIRALGIGTGNLIMTFEQRSSFIPSTERAHHHTPTGIPEGRCSFASTLSLALPNPPSPLLVTRRHIPKLFQGGTRTCLLSGYNGRTS